MNSNKPPQKQILKALPLNYRKTVKSPHRQTLLISLLVKINKIKIYKVKAMTSNIKPKLVKQNFKILKLKKKKIIILQFRQKINKINIIMIKIDLKYPLNKIKLFFFYLKILIKIQKFIKYSQCGLSSFFFIIYALFMKINIKLNILFN